MSDYLNDDTKGSIKLDAQHIEAVPPLQSDVRKPDGAEVEGIFTVLGSSGQNPDAKHSVSFQAYTIVALCALGAFLNVFYGIAPAAASYSIAGSLNGMDKRIWIVQAQGIPSIVTGPIGAIIADIYGRRYVVLASLLCCATGAILAMTAHTVDLVIVGQAMIGVSAGIIGTFFAISSEVVPSRNRAYVQMFVNAFGGLSCLPALLGMGAAEVIDPAEGWRWIFRSILIMTGILLLGFGFLYFPPPRTVQRGSLWQRLAKLDWIGYFLLFAGLIPLLMGFSWASDSNYGWSDPHAYGCVAAGSAGFIACLFYEWKGRNDGFLHHGLFRDGRNFPISMVLVAVEGSLFYLVNNLYSSQVYSLWQTGGGIIAACWLIPFYLVISFLGPFLSLYVSGKKDIKWPIFFGFVFFSSAVIGWGTTTPNSKYPALAYNILAGIGFSTPLTFLMALVQLSTPPLFIGSASALTISSRTLGGVVGYAIAEVIYNSLFNKKVPDAIAAAVVPLGFSPANLGQLIVAILSHGDPSKVTGTTPAIIGAAYQAYADKNAYAFRITWLAFLPGVVVAALLTLLLKNPKERMNWIVDAPLRDEDRAEDQLAD